MPLSPAAVAAPARLLSDRAAGTQSSAIRDLLDQAQRPGMISLAGGLPDATRFPTPQLAEVARAVIEQDGEHVLQYGATRGDALARHALATLFQSDTTISDTTIVDGDDVVVTTGSQQALDLIARVVVNPGDQVVVGDPDYLGALQVFRSYGAEVRPIAVDHDGLNTDQLEDDLRWGLRPKCLYLVPNFHNPTGITMSVARRQHLNELSATYGFLVIEDDPYRELYFGDSAPTDVAADPELTVRLRSTSKTLAPGLRVGALAGPTWLVDQIVTAKQSADLHTSTLTQAIVAQALGAPWLNDHLVGLRSLYQSKRDALIAALDASFDGAVEFSVPSGGMFLWARFHHVADTTAWLTRCLDNGVCFVPGQAFAVTRNLANFARLSYATGAPEDLTQAISRMKRSGRLA